MREIIRIDNEASIYYNPNAKWLSDMYTIYQQNKFELKRQLVISEYTPLVFRPSVQTLGSAQEYKTLISQAGNYRIEIYLDVLVDFGYSPETSYRFAPSTVVSIRLLKNSTPVWMYHIPTRESFTISHALELPLTVGDILQIEMKFRMPDVIKRSRIGHSSDGSYMYNVRLPSGYSAGNLALDNLGYLLARSWSTYDSGIKYYSRYGSGTGVTRRGFLYGQTPPVSRLALTSFAYYDWETSTWYLVNGASINGNALEAATLDLDTEEYSAFDFTFTVQGKRFFSSRSTRYFDETTDPRTDHIITTDGRFLYDLSYTDYTKFLIRIWDLANDNKWYKDLEISEESYYTDGILAFGGYIYPIEWSGSNRIRIYSFNGEKLYQYSKYPTYLISGQINPWLKIAAIGYLTGRRIYIWNTSGVGVVGVRNGWIKLAKIG